MTIDNFGVFCLKECLLKRTGIEDKKMSSGVDQHLCDRQYCSAILRDAIAYTRANWQLDRRTRSGQCVSSIMSFDGDSARVPCYLLSCTIANKSLVYEIVLGMLI